MQSGRIFCIGLLTLALSACQLVKPRVDAPPVLAPANPVALAAPPAPTPMPVPAARAVALLDAVCGASLPKFGTIDATLRANGFALASGTTTMSSASEEVSFRLADGPGDGKTCAMTFATTEGPDAVKATFGSLGTFKDTPLGSATKYRGRNAILIYDGPGQQIAGAQYYTVRLLSER
jgi:hypothetical protein